MTDRFSGKTPTGETSNASSSGGARAPANVGPRRGDTLRDAVGPKRKSIPIVAPTPNQFAEYVGARPLPQPTHHKTLEIERVKVATGVDPKRAETLPSLAKQKAAAEGSEPIPLIQSPRPETPGADEGLGSLAPHESESSSYHDASYIEGARRALGAVRWLVIGSSLALVVALFALTYALLNRTPVAVRPVSSSQPERREVRQRSKSGVQSVRVVIPTPPSSALPRSAPSTVKTAEPRALEPQVRDKTPRAPAPAKGSTQKPPPESKSPKPGPSSGSSSSDLWLE